MLGSMAWFLVLMNPNMTDPMCGEPLVIRGFASPLCVPDEVPGSIRAVSRSH